MLSKHGKPSCNECNKNLPTFMELLKHMAQNHYEEGDPHEKITQSVDIQSP